MKQIKSRMLLKGILTFFLLVGFASVLSNGLAQNTEEVEEQVRQLFREVKGHLDKDEFTEAYKKCEQALRLKPEASLLRFLRDDLGEKYLQIMLSTPELRQTALRLMELSKGSVVRLRVDPEMIKSLVGVLDTDSYVKKWEAIGKLAAIGQLACPYLIENIGNEKNERLRANSIDCLRKMMYESVLALIEALNSKNQLTRQNATLILGAIKDERAVPELKRLLEDPNELPEVKTYVSDALQKITGQYPEVLDPAKVYYYKLAEKYYYSHPTVMINPYGQYIIWRWNDAEDKITWREVPEFAFNEELAEECIYDAMRLDENYEEVLPLLVCVHLAQHTEGELGLTATQIQVDRGEVDKDTLTRLQNDLAPVKGGLLFGAMGTRKYLYQALERSLIDRNVLVAEAVLKFLKVCGDADDLPLPPFRMPAPEELVKMLPAEKTQWELKHAQWEQDNKRKIGGPLLKALKDDDKRVKYTAAETLMKIAPRRHFPDEDKVIPTIQEALGESGVRVVLIIESNEEVRAKLKKELLKLNCFPIEALTGQEGLEQAKRFPSEDLIIVNAKIANHVVFSTITPLGTKIAETVFDSLKQDMRTKNTPIFLLTEAQNLDTIKEAFKEEPQGSLTTPIDRITLENELNKVFSTEKAQVDSKGRAEAMAQKAAEALANLDLVNCVYPYLSAVDALISVLEGRPDQVRIPAMRALGRFGDKKSIMALTKVFHNKENKKETRIAAGQSLAEVYKLSGEAMVEETYQVLRDGLQEGDFDIEMVVANVFGNAVLTPQQRREIFQIKRIHPK